MSGDGALLMTTVVALVAICAATLALAVAMRRWGMPWVSAMGKSLRGDATPPTVTILERVALEPRRALYVVAVRGRTLLLGSSDLGITMLAEVEAAGVAEGASMSVAEEGQRG